MNTDTGRHHTPPHHELVLGGQKSGKSQHAEQRAAHWLAQHPHHQASLLATATAGDAEMAARIARHQADRTQRAPGLRTLQRADGSWNGDLAGALLAHTQPDHLLVVDCLTVWLTELMMPLQGPGLDDAALATERQRLVQALNDAHGPVVLVSNEIGLGISPLGPEVRRFVDHLGQLHQQVARACGRVTLMVAGCALTVKETA
jgi:adenosylcobinamide kinase/adenosylcobinamide-phosphate guanylyltransferase